jgi:hypothetical protein
MVSIIKRKKDNLDDAISKIFNPETLISSKTIYKNNLYLISDDDLIHMMK